MITLGIKKVKFLENRTFQYYYKLKQIALWHNKLHFYTFNDKTAVANEK